MQTKPVVVSQTYDASVEKVWTAITQADQMRQWFFEDMQEFQPVVGFETEFEVDCEGEIYRHCWRINEVIPNQRIVYGWKYAGIPGSSLVTWELMPERDGQSTLKLTHVAQEPFPDDDPNFSSESCQAGWQYFLQDRLQDFLSRHEV